MSWLYNPMLPAIADIPELLSIYRAVILQNREQICGATIPSASCSGAHTSISHNPHRAIHLPHQVAPTVFW
jgi:hypothetical protein